MQCILTRQDFDFYYHGERYTSDQAQSFTCPFCGEMGFSLPFISEGSPHLDLFHHVQLKHGDEQQSSEVICPICAAMINGEPNLVTSDLLSHIANDHQQQQVQTPSTAGIGSNPYMRQSSSNRESDFTNGAATRGGFRRGPLRTPSRRGTLGRGGGTVSQHFVVDPSSSSSGNDPIADLLTQLSTVRRLAAASNNNNNNNGLSSNTINLQTLTRQQYERERLRTTGRTHYQQQSHHAQQANSSSSSSNPLPSLENDFFDSLFASALFIDSSSTSNNNHQTWAQIVAQQQPTSEQQQQQQQQQQSSLTSAKASLTEPDPSLLRRFCDESPFSSLISPQNTTVTQQQKRKNDFVHSLLFSSFVCPLNDKDK